MKHIKSFNESEEKLNTKTFIIDSSGGGGCYSDILQNYQFGDIIIRRYWVDNPNYIGDWIKRRVADKIGGELHFQHFTDNGDPAISTKYWITEK